MEDVARKGRIRLKFVPLWEGAIEGYVVSFCKINEWRVQPALSFMDLYQEAWLLFDKCRELYPLVTEAKHFMALFKTALYRFTNSLATQRTKRRETSFSFTDFSGSEHDNFSDVLLSKDGLDEAEVKMMLEDAPAIVRRIWQQFGDGATQPQRFKRQGKIRETTQSFLARIARVDPYVCNIVKDITRWVNGEELQCQSVS